MLLRPPAAPVFVRLAGVVSDVFARSACTMSFLVWQDKRSFEKRIIQKTCALVLVGCVYVDYTFAPPF
jgi:hypothetical protein